MRGETIRVHRAAPGDRDEHGNEQPGTVEVLEFPGFAVAAATSDDRVTTVGTRVITGYLLYRRKPADISTTDTIEIRGVPGWQVDGEVFEWRSPYTGVRRGVQFAVKRGA